jgi:hypothetical protein
MSINFRRHMQWSLRCLVQISVKTMAKLEPEHYDTDSTCNNVRWYFHKGRAWNTLSVEKVGCSQGLLTVKKIKLSKKDASRFCHLECDSI